MTVPESTINILLSVDSVSTNGTTDTWHGRCGKKKKINNCRFQKSFYKLKYDRFLRECFGKIRFSDALKRR